MHNFQLECTTCGERYHAAASTGDVRSYCLECGTKLEQYSHNQVLRTLLLSTASLVLLIPANVYPLLRFSFQGQWRENEIITGSVLLFQQNSPVVAFAVFFTSVVAPFVLHGMISTAALGMLTGWYPRLTRNLWRWLFEFEEWGMIDVYLVALGVGAIKLLSMGSVDPEPGLWMVLLFVLTSGICVGSMNACAIWTEWRMRHAEKDDVPEITDGASVTCYHCGTVQAEDAVESCLICRAPLHQRELDESKTWAYLLAAVALYVPANVLPVMNLSIVGDKADYTVMGGIMYLWREDDYLPASIVFCGSVIVPVLKMVVLFALLFTHRLGRYQKFQTALYRVVKTLGRWSMVDLFVLGVLVALGQMGVVATVEPKLGAVAFCGVVIFTMFAANSYQAWWIWTRHPDPKTDKTYAYGTSS